MKSHLRPKSSILSGFLRERRVAKNLTQTQVGKSLGYTSQFIANWERNASSPPAHVIPKLMKVLTISEQSMLNVLNEDSANYWESVVRGKRSKRDRGSK